MNDLKISKSYLLSDLVEVGDTFAEHIIENYPKEQASIVAIRGLVVEILEPVKEEYPDVKLTYGFAGASLIRKIGSRIAPKLDQHAAHDLSSRGKRICERDGFAVDLIVPGISSAKIASFIVRELPFDRLYFYGAGRPLHVSYGPDHSRKICVMAHSEIHGRWFPRVSSTEKFLEKHE